MPPVVIPTLTVDESHSPCGWPQGGVIKIRCDDAIITEHEQSSILTSNKAFGEWGQVFADDSVMASAALDRLLHRSTVINIRGEGYRLKEKPQW